MGCNGGAISGKCVIQGRLPLVVRERREAKKRL